MTSRPTIPEALLASPGFLLALVGAESRRRWVQALAGLDLRPSHYAALVSLGAAGPLSQHELGLALGIDPRNLVAVVDLLENRGLVERRPDPRDRRRHAVRVTTAGRRRLGELRKRGETAEQELLASLTPSERRLLRDLLRKLAVGVTA